MDKRDWTDEDVQNAVAFGTCPLHRTPMQVEAFLDVADDGHVTQRYDHFCPTCKAAETVAEQSYEFGVTFEPRAVENGGSEDQATS